MAGTFYEAKDTNGWITFPAVLLGDDPAGSVFIIVYETPAPGMDVAPVPPYVRRAVQVEELPEEGEGFFIP